MKTQTIKHAITASTILALSFSMNVFAADYDTSADHNHGGLSSDENMKMRHNMGMQGKMPMQGGMKARMEAMQAEMQAIVNTQDRAKRQAMFTAHKQKMKGMMGMMQKMHGDCKPGMKGAKSSLDHQGEAD